MRISFVRGSALGKKAFTSYQDARFLPMLRSTFQDSREV
jgi:hypothetical protein